MRDIIVKIYESGRYEKVKRILGYEGENISRNLIIKMDKFIEGSAILEVRQNDKKYFLDLEKQEDKYVLPIYESLLKSSEIDMQLTIFKDNNIVYKSDIFSFKIGESINATDKETPDEYSSWLSEANTKLAEMKNLIKDLNEKVENDFFKGEKGSTPQKGIDYWTLEEQQEIIDEVVKHFVDAEEEAY